MNIKNKKEPKLRKPKLLKTKYYEIWILFLLLNIMSLYIFLYVNMSCNKINVLGLQPSLQYKWPT